MIDTDTTDVLAQVKISAPRKTSARHDMFGRAMLAKPAVLNQLGFKELRPGQEGAVYNLFMQQDTICVLPTSGGKSAIYIIPTLCHGWRCLIFSPLISLMQDQVESLWRYKLPAAQVSSGQSDQENRMALLGWEAGETQFLLVAPERLQDPKFRELMERRKPNLVAVDEAHCLSSWGFNFRPSYCVIGEFIEQLKPDCVLSLTATATSRVLLDIRNILGLQDAHQIVYFPKRDNLLLESHEFVDDNDILEIVNEIDGPTIVYCLTRTATEDLYMRYGRRVKGGALVYNGEVGKDERFTNQTLFMRNEIRVMFATNAFGMGVNKPDIRGIIHRDVPRSVESYMQEIGRAGRDGHPSRCVLFVSEKSFATGQWFIEGEHPCRRDIERVFEFVRRRCANGPMMIAGDEIADALGIKNARIVGTALNQLALYKVLSREKTDPVYRARLLKAHADSKFGKVLSAIERVGVLQNDGFYDFKLPALVNETKMSDKTLQTKLRDLDKNAYIEYTRPFRGLTTNVTGDINLVNFDELDNRREHALRNLNTMRRFTLTPDDRKHDFLQHYFTTQH